MHPFSLPGSYLVMELTNICSLRCLHCSVSEAEHPHHQKHGFIAMNLVERLFQDLSTNGASFDTLIPFWLGEPLLHPQFVEIYRASLRVAAESGCFRKVEVHSNATHLDAKTIMSVINRSKVPQVWHFSLDAVSEEVYRRVKGVQRMEKVRANIRSFLEEKARLSAPWPRPVFQFIVSDRNAQEAERFAEEWEGFCKKLGFPVVRAAQKVPGGQDAVVFFRQLDCPTVEEQRIQNGVFMGTMQRMGLKVEGELERVEADNRGICGCFWKSPVVSWDGWLTTCTRDNHLQNRVGSLRETSFTELWWGKTMHLHRQAVARSDYNTLPLCTTCFIPSSSNYSDIRPEEIPA